MKQVWQLIDQTWIPSEYQSKQNNWMNKRGKECTWVMSRFTSWKIKVSKQTQNNRMHIIEWNKSIMYSNQSIKYAISVIQSHYWNKPKYQWSVPHKKKHDDIQMSTKSQTPVQVGVVEDDIWSHGLRVVLRREM